MRGGKPQANQLKLGMQSIPRPPHEVLRPVVSESRNPEPQWVGELVVAHTH